ncbi:MAG: DUF58 domain-containing protein [Acidimicrobiia bacterium]|nr:DUF58 domain-containing protein [Acidimicrobiia bacterium]
MTTRGLAALVTGTAAVLTGRIFGIVELMIIGATLAGVVVLATLMVVSPRGRLVPARRLRPQRIAAGGTAHVDLRLGHLGKVSSGLLRLRDGVAGTRGAELHATPLRPGEQRQATYRLPPATRGVLTVGPLEVDRIDAFGIARRRVAWLDSSELLVHPRIHPIAPPSRPRAADMASSVATPIREFRGDDFHALRPYEQGDDLRRVHWRATARHDELMIREHDDTREGRTTVVADIRESSVTAASIERILEAAASVLTAAAARGDECALVLTDGSGPYEAFDSRSVSGLLDALARVEPTAITSLDPAVQVLRRSARAGTLVSLMGAGDSQSTSILGPGFQSHVSLRFGDTPQPSDPTHVVDDFTDVWTDEMQRREMRARSGAGS